MSRLFEAIRDELTCPTCGYSLRGLAGQEVVCPECGGNFRVAKLARAYWRERWRQQWQQTPACRHVYSPVIWLFLGLAGISFIFQAFHPLGEGSFTRTDGIVIALCLAVVAAGWAWLAWRTCRWFGSSKGLWLVGLGHLVVIWPMLLLGMIFVAIEALARLTPPSWNDSRFGQTLMMGALLLCVLVAGGASFPAFLAYRQIGRSSYRREMRALRRASLRDLDQKAAQERDGVKSGGGSRGP